MVYGNIPRDYGNLTFTHEEMMDFIKNEPNSKKLFRKFLGAEEFINRKTRYYLFTQFVMPNELRSMPNVKKRVEAVRDARLASKAKEIQKFAENPTKMAQLTQPLDCDFLIVPIISSEKRRYIPIGYEKPGTLVNNAVQVVPNANLYEFGVLTSVFHNAWMRALCGRLESRYRYSKDLIYNTFPWPTANKQQKAKIEKSAKMILDARSQYPDSSLADLYDDSAMPLELRKAHQINDVLVAEAYGFKGKVRSESECVAELIKMYQELVSE